MSELREMAKIAVQLSWLEPAGKDEFRRKDWRGRPEIPAAALLRTMSLIAPDGEPYVVIPFYIHDGNPATVHTICRRGADDEDVIDRMRL